MINYSNKRRLLSRLSDYEVEKKVRPITAAGLFNTDSTDR